MNGTVCHLGMLFGVKGKRVNFIILIEYQFFLLSKFLKNGRDE